MSNYHPTNGHLSLHGNVRSITTGSAGNPQTYSSSSLHHTPASVVHRVTGPMYGPIAAWRPPVQAIGPATVGMVPIVPQAQGFVRPMFNRSPAMISPVRSPAVTVESSDSPLDLSVKKTKTTTAAALAGVDMVAYSSKQHSDNDAPLDLSKPSRIVTTGCREVHHEPQETIMYTTRPHSASSGGAISTGYTSSRSADSDQDRHGQQGSNSTAIAALIGNHPIDDILYLHCTRCQSSYGSVHNFRKHFRNAHGYIPSKEDVFIQGIQQTKDYVAKQRHATSQSLLHCSYCAWQCEATRQEAFASHMFDHSRSSTGFKCMHCGLACAGSEYLREHIRQHPGIYHHICTMCNFAFLHEEQLSTHIAQCHNRSSLPRMSPSSTQLTSVNHLHTPRPGQPSPVMLPESRLAAQTAELSKSSSRSVAQLLKAQRQSQTPTLAEHIEAAVTRELVGGGQTPRTVGDLLFMQQQQQQQNGLSKMSPKTRLSSTASTPTSSPSVPPRISLMPKSESAADAKQPLNLLSLLDRVVEHGLRNPSDHVQKPDLNFTVTLSEDSSDESLPKNVVTTTPGSLNSASPPSEEREATPKEQSDPADQSVSATTNTRLVQKTIMQHIEDAVTRELTAFKPDQFSLRKPRLDISGLTSPTAASYKRTPTPTIIPADSASDNKHERENFPKSTCSNNEAEQTALSEMPTSSLSDADVYDEVTTSATNYATAKKRQVCEIGSDTDSDSSERHTKLRIVEDSPQQIENTIAM